MTKKASLYMFRTGAQILFQALRIHGWLESQVQNLQLERAERTVTFQCQAGCEVFTFTFSSKPEFLAISHSFTRRFNMSMWQVWDTELMIYTRLKGEELVEKQVGQEYCTPKQTFICSDKRRKQKQSKDLLHLEPKETKSWVRGKNPRAVLTQEVPTTFRPSLNLGELANGARTTNGWCWPSEDRGEGQGNPSQTQFLFQTRMLLRVKGMCDDLCQENRCMWETDMVGLYNRAGYCQDGSL